MNVTFVIIRRYVKTERKVMNNKQKSHWKCKFPLKARDLYTNEILSDKSFFKPFFYKSVSKPERLVKSLGLKQSVQSHMSINETLS